MSSKSSTSSCLLVTAHDPVVRNLGAENVSFYTPVQDPPAGTAISPQPDCSLFSPLKVGNMTLQNRIIVSPMCQYSASNGYFTAWHKQHLGSLAARGPGLVITEVLAITAQGRITPEDAGIWEDGQVAVLKEVTEFAHSQNSKICAQIGHAGRKASTLSPWLGRGVAQKEAGGWPNDVYGVSDVPHHKTNGVTPRCMSLADIEALKEDFAVAFKRALEAGFDAIEIHAANGYLLHCFLSPAANNRTDAYGGQFENRVRLLLEIVQIAKNVLPVGYPILVRIPGTDYLFYDESLPQWHVGEAAKLARILAKSGIHLLDVCGGGLDERQKISVSPGYQIPWAAAVKKAVAGTGVAVTGVGAITSATQAQGYIGGDDAAVDAVMVGRHFLQNPNLVLHWAAELGVQIYSPIQYGWPYGMRRKFNHE